MQQNLGTLQGGTLFHTLAYPWNLDAEGFWETVLLKDTLSLDASSTSSKKWSAPLSSESVWSNESFDCWNNAASTTDLSKRRTIAVKKDLTVEWLLEVTFRAGRRLVAATSNSYIGGGMSLLGGVGPLFILDKRWTKVSESIAMVILATGIKVFFRSQVRS